jgi:osmotically-inducible protein OsmY
MRRRNAITAGTCVLAMSVLGAACSDRDGARPADAVAAPVEAVRDGGRAADAAMETFDVKTALMRDERVDAGDINVDTDHQTKTVVLKGRVPTAEQKTIAGDIATAQATGYRVQNDLVVGQS